MNRADFTFEKMFFITTTAMHLNRSHPAITRNLFWVVQFIVMLSLSALSFLLLTNSVVFYDIPSGSYTEASKNGTMAIVALTITFKYIFLLYYQATIKTIIDIMNTDYQLALDFETEEREIVMKYVKKGTKVSVFWLVAASLTSAVFPLKALYGMAYSYLYGEFKYVLMFDMRYPDRIDVAKEDPVVFVVFFTLCFMFDCYADSMYIGFDPLVPIFLLHICGQLDILSKRMLKIFNHDTEAQDINDKLKFINVKLQDLYWLIKTMKSKFTVLLEFNMKTTTFLLPFSLIQVVEDLRRKQFNLEFLTFFIATVLHFYMPCYYSDVLLERSDNLRQAIYSCGWDKHPDKQVRKTILLMMTRTTAPLVLSTVFYPICLDTFAEMCRQSYAIFNIMNTACV